MPRSRRSAAHRYHDRVAGHYDHSYDDAFWQWHDALTWDYLKPFLPRDLSAAVIDLGCGTGKWAAKLLESGFTVTCLDISHRMFENMLPDSLDSDVLLAVGLAAVAVALVFALDRMTGGGAKQSQAGTLGQ